MTFILLRLGSLGNVAMMAPLVASLSRRYPQHRFVVVSKKKLSALFYGLDNVIYHEAHFDDCGYKCILSLYHELQAYQPNHVIDLQNVLRTQVLRCLFKSQGIPITVIRYGRWQKLRMCWCRHYQEILPTETERYRATLLSAGLETDTDFEALPIHYDARLSVQNRYGKRDGEWIGIAPFAKSRSNMLPYRLTKQLINQLVQRPNIHIFLFGAGQIECEILRQWASIFPHVTSVAGELTLNEELELMRQLDYIICMDSANQHLSSLVHLRAISVWCATHPKMGFYAWKQSSNDCIQQSYLKCRPCTVHGTNHCRYHNFACQDLSIEQIIHTIYE